MRGELGSITPRIQEKILRVIEYGEFQRVGGAQTLRTDIRVVGATNEHLPRLAQLGRFRADLLGHAWPGNVRELKNAIERSVYRSDEPLEPVDEILFDPFASPFTASLSVAHESETVAAAPPLTADERVLPDDFRSAVAHYERNLLQRALERAQFKQTLAAKLLGLSYHQFRTLLRKYGMTKTTGSDEG